MFQAHENPSSPKPASGGQGDSTTSRRAAILVALFALTLSAAWAAQRSEATPTPTGPVVVKASQAGIHFSGQLDRSSVLESGDGIVKMELVLGADPREAVGGLQVPTDLVVILDRSGSMQGEPMAHAKASVRELISQLADGDRLAVVTYSAGAELAIPLSRANGEARERWNHAVDAIAVGGGTNMARGLDLATQTVSGQREAGRSVRLILLSDGHANQGDHSREGLRARAARAIAGEYVLSTVGVGHGFDESLMTALADAGTGNFYYVQRGGDLAKVFAGEFASARETVASALAVAINTAPGVQVVDAAGYPLERNGSRVLFRPGSLFAGQERRIWLTLRAPTDHLGELDLGDFSLAFSEAGERRVISFDSSPRLTCVRDETDYYASMDDDAWARSVIEDEYNELKQRVSGAIQAGKEDVAKAAISSFRAKQSAINVHVKSKDVEEQLGELRHFESEVDAAFAPSASRAARSAASKKLQAEGYDGRRAGAKY
ncbi:MAG: VWA domain-containing protein [Deltaproteobacteria bacterium]|nr:VWA domain-containing protein [Deltaproteobacteria bacterium]MBW2418196.1 VWA domain-containing protein [Deltaproteobacteria bacterium]